MRSRLVIARDYWVTSGRIVGVRAREERQICANMACAHIEGI